MLEPGSDIDKHFKDGFEGQGDLRGLEANWEVVQAGLPKAVLGSVLLGKLIHGKIAGVSLSTLSVVTAVTLTVFSTSETPPDIYEPLGNGNAELSAAQVFSDEYFEAQAQAETRNWLATSSVAVSDVQAIVLPTETPVQATLASRASKTPIRINHRFRLLQSKPFVGLPNVYRDDCPIMPLGWNYSFLEDENGFAEVPPHVVRQIDSAVLASMPPAPNFKNRLLARWEVSFIGGATWGKGFSNLSTEEGNWELSPLIGVGLDYNINTRLGIIGEVHYLRRNGNRLRTSTTEEQFFLRREDVTRQVNIQSLEYLHLPISARYRLNNLHSFTGGMCTSILLITSSERLDVVDSNDGYQEANLGAK
ncbi:MAG: outer membrane beta-barrel protein [Salibacteraceae bacterium]